VTDDQLLPFRGHPDRAALVIDYDGTLSPIVEDPADALPLPGMAELLAGLAERYERVAVVSGRPVSFLLDVLPDSLILTGLYGLEATSGGQRFDHPLGGSWREVIDDVAALAEVRGPEGMRVERKGLSLTLHFRAHPELEEAVKAFADGQAARSGLVCRPARMSFELHPPIDVDKGTAVRNLARGIDALCYIGDDVGDLAAFDALDELSGDGVSVLRVAVRSNESNAELLERADLVVDGPEGVRDLLERLVAAA
jgi:trehalose 6-phosphate phosphatase